MENTNTQIKKFIGVKKSSGSGLCYGDGYGSGSGSGYGYGYGSGSGLCYFDGSGDCYGYGSGSGSGSGSGDGDGDGDGSRSGGIASYCADTVYRIDGVDTVIKNVHGNVAKGFVVNLDLTITPCVIVKHGNLFAHGSTIKDAEAALNEKIFDDLDTNEKIKAFWGHFENGVKYPAKDFYDWHHKLTGSCEFGRQQFAKNHGIDLDNDMFTASEFIDLTKNNYGGEIIKKLLEEDES